MDPFIHTSPHTWSPAAATRDDTHPVTDHQPLEYLMTVVRLGDHTTQSRWIFKVICNVIFEALREPAFDVDGALAPCHRPPPHTFSSFNPSGSLAQK